MTESFLALNPLQYSSATTSSGLPSEFYISMYGLSLTRFKSSCNRSRKKLMSSHESCCPYPENLATHLPMIFFTSEGAVELEVPIQRFRISKLNVVANLPPVPSGFSLLTSFFHNPKQKYLVSSVVLEMH